MAVHIQMLDTPSKHVVSDAAGAACGRSRRDAKMRPEPQRFKGFEFARKSSQSKDLEREGSPP